MPSVTKHITVVAGHYGSGKTEFSVNLAFSLARQNKPVSVVDLDIVNPYFCSREREEQLNQAGIALIAQSQACRTSDVPALPAEVSRMFYDKTRSYIVDVGGDDVGARVLARYNPQFMACEHDFWLVVNANRPQTATAEMAASYIRRIENACRLKTTGIINNTHLCGHTTLEEVVRGNLMTQALCKMTGLPLICNVVPKTLLDGERNITDQISGELYPIDIWMKKPWEI